MRPTRAAPTGVPVSAPSGAQIGEHYRVEASLGRGGMGEVYRVVDERSGARVALKRHVSPQTTGADARALALQFEREYYTLCQLAHPRIIEVYDYGLDEVGAFYTMELLDGQDLRERGKLPWREAAALLLDVASSLAILHSRGLLHRDLSPRNVRCTADGRAKLIDFGAMMPMGIAKSIVGTPPFIAPESLQLSTLDARVDLFALGALAYWTLAGRTCFPAQRVDELHALWMTPPAPVARWAPDIPESLDRLVMELLHLDRMARPQTAAEVMERLSGLAGLPRAERAEVTRAYLVTPPLIGRDECLSPVRAQFATAMHGRGMAALITGAAGSGRSRLLDECVLEAKLLGATVLRADAELGETGGYGVARALASQLWQAWPHVAETNAERSRAVLSGIVPQLAETREAPATAPERHVVQTALRDWFLAAAREKWIVLAVDDADEIDEPSAALLAALAARSEGRGVTLFVSTNAATALTPALAFVRSAGLTIELAPFRAEQTAALLRAVFGTAASTSVAQRIHQLSGGNPRWTMVSCEWLVERGVARYEAGSWTLPSELAPRDLPASLTAALAESLAALPPDARELAEVLCLTDPSVLSLDAYPELTEHRDRARTYRALEALSSAGILLASADRYRFRTRELPELLERSSTDARRRELHGRLARVLETRAESTRLLHHMFLAGQERAAIERLLAQPEEQRMEASALALALLYEASQAADRLQLPLRVALELRAWMVYLAAVLGDYALFVRYGVPLLERFELDSGIVDLRDHADVPESERLTRALTELQRRYDATPEPDRGLSPLDAMRAIARLSAAFVSMATLAQDYDLVARIPSLAPLASLSPAFAAVELVIEASRDFQAGRYELAQQRYLAALSRIEQPDRAGLDPAQHAAMRFGLLYVQGVFAAVWGIPTAIDWVAPLANEPGHRANALRVHMTSELMQGNVEAALVSEHRAELMQLQDVGQTRYVGTTARIELLAYAWSDDVLGVKRSLERIEEVARRFPRWEADVHLARYQYRRLQGDHAGAIEAVEQALALTSPGRHLDWALAATAHVMALTAADRAPEAVERGRDYLEIHDRERLSGTRRDVMQALAEALVKVGQLTEAASLADQCLAEVRALGTRGLLLGGFLETRARVALAARDEAGFRAAAEGCAGEYNLGRNGALTARYERLMRAAANLSWSDRSGRARVATGNTSHAVAPALGITARLARCTDSGERANVALQALLEASRATAGYLFGLRAGKLERLSSTGAAEPTPELLESLDVFLRRELATDYRAEDVATQVSADRTLRDASSKLVFEPIVLVTQQYGERVVTGLAVLGYADGPHAAPNPNVFTTVADSLIQFHDVDPITYIA